MIKDRFEYMAYAKPIVLYDLKEGRRSAGDAALYARPNDTTDFAEQIVKLLESGSLRQSLGALGRKRVEGTPQPGKRKARTSWVRMKLTFVSENK